MTAPLSDPHLAPELPLTRIVVRRQALSSTARLAWALRAARSWLGPEREAVAHGMHRYEADLRLRTSDAPPLVTFRKAAYVDIGPLRALNGGWQVEIGWRSSSLAPLFPVFAGTVVIRERRAHAERLVCAARRRDRASGGPRPASHRRRGNRSLVPGAH